MRCADGFGSSTCAVRADVSSRRSQLLQSFDRELLARPRCQKCNAWVVSISAYNPLNQSTALPSTESPTVPKAFADLEAESFRID